MAATTPVLMSPRRRVQVIRQVAEALGALNKAEADLLLRAARAASLTPGDFNLHSAYSARDLLLTQLATEADGVLLGLVNLLEEGDESAPEPQREVAPTHDGPIFVVHGHARQQLYEAVRVLERSTDRHVIVLHEQANAGRTIIEKFEDHASGVAYAVVLLTADDAGGTIAADERQPRGRQNVVFELGFFFGKLGRDRVAVLLDPSVEKPSDIDGLVYITLDPAGAWKQALARELQAAGIAVDFGSIP